MLIGPRNNLFVILLLIFRISFQVFVEAAHPETLLNFQERVKLNGYPCDVHKIVTEDDYIITLYRIPHGLEKHADEPKNKSVILIGHGLGGAPYNFIVMGKKIAPAYYFADRGFDIWLMCFRGVHCQNPKKHKRLDWDKDKEYWHYSMHEVGVYDISASIDYIINVTGQQSMFYIGHSGGSPNILVLLSDRPEYNNKIKIASHWGGGTISEMDYPLFNFLIDVFAFIKNIVNTLGIAEIMPSGIYDLFISVTSRMCVDPDFWKICFYLAPGILNNMQSNLIDMDKDLVELLFSTFPRVSVQQVYHYVDNLQRGDFRKYDRGPKKNMKIYGQKVPPLYNLSAITSLNVFFYGTTDTISSLGNIRVSRELLPNTLGYEIGPKWGHVDFIFSKNASYLLEPTVKLFNDFDEGKVQSRVIGKNNNYNR